MPGTFTAIFLLAFDVDPRGQPVPAFTPRSAAGETAALEEAHKLAERHAGVVVWKREAKPVIREEGEPVIIWQAGAIGDFNCASRSCHRWELVKPRSVLTSGWRRKGAVFVWGRLPCFYP
jgi:hypothetical protein